MWLCSQLLSGMHRNEASCYATVFLHATSDKKLEAGKAWEQGYVCVRVCVCVCRCVVSFSNTATAVELPLSCLVLRQECRPKRFRDLTKLSIFTSIKTHWHTEICYRNLFYRRPNCQIETCSIFPILFINLITASLF